jgi:hypothetical protein
MDGTVARLRLNPGREAHRLAFHAAEHARGIRGYLARYVYRMDQDSNE